MYELFNSGNFNPSEMSKTKTFIFGKKCVSLCFIYYDR